MLTLCCPALGRRLSAAEPSARILAREDSPMKSFALLSSCAVLLLLAGCSSDTPGPAEKKAEEKPAEPVTGRQALQQMYIAARGWAVDIQPIKLNSILLPELKAEPGKAAAWQATFVAASLGKARSYTYSVVESEGNLHKGVFAGLDQSWSGPSGVTKPFQMAAIKVDSDQAYQTALKKAADYDKKNPGKPITYLLESTAKYPDPAWRVIWGESVGTSNFSVFVDASTGQYLEVV